MNWKFEQDESEKLPARLHIPRFAHDGVVWRLEPDQLGIVGGNRFRFGNCQADRRAIHMIGLLVEKQAFLFGETNCIESCESRRCLLAAWSLLGEWREISPRRSAPFHAAEKAARLHFALVRLFAGVPPTAPPENPDCGSSGSSASDNSAFPGDPSPIGKPSSPVNGSPPDGEPVASSPF